MLTETRHWFMQPKSDPSPQAVGTSFLELEITGFCQPKCRHCYAGSSPEGDHGTMTADDWERVIDNAQALSVDTVQFIGGEPTLHPEPTRTGVDYPLDCARSSRSSGRPRVSRSASAATPW
jgi:sulfatase maturation enzyme AslB (radical SAM superfamily)